MSPLLWHFVIECVSHGTGAVNICTRLRHPLARPGLARELLPVSGQDTLAVICPG
jgi:hypothetical protein